MIVKKDDDHNNKNQHGIPITNKVKAGGVVMLEDLKRHYEGNLIIPVPVTGDSNDSSPYYNSNTHVNDRQLNTLN